MSPRRSFLGPLLLGMVLPGLFLLFLEGVAGRPGVEAQGAGTNARLFGIDYVSGTFAPISARGQQIWTKPGGIVNAFAQQTGTGTTAAFDVPYAVDHATVMVPGGGPAACTATLQGSLDNVTWADLSGSITCTATIYTATTGKPARYVRMSLTALTGGANVTTTYIGR